MMPSLKIFVVDDDADDRYFLAEAINAVIQPVDIVELTDGLELMQAIESIPAENNSVVVLLDMNMPKMNGLETLRAIRSNPLHAHIPTVMISTSSDAKLIESAHYEGIDGFITKPNSFEGFILLARQLTNDYLKG